MQWTRHSTYGAHCHTETGVQALHTYFPGLPQNCEQPATHVPANASTVVLFPQFHELGVAKGVLSLPHGLSPDHHLCHLALCLETLVCNHCLMKFRVQPLYLARAHKNG